MKIEVREEAEAHDIAALHMFLGEAVLALAHVSSLKCGEIDNVNWRYNYDEDPDGMPVLTYASRLGLQRLVDRIEDTMHTLVRPLRDRITDERAPPSADPFEPNHWFHWLREPEEKAQREEHAREEANRAEGRAQRARGPSTCPTGPPEPDFGPSRACRCSRSERWSPRSPKQPRNGPGICHPPVK